MCSCMLHLFWAVGLRAANGPVSNQDLQCTFQAIIPGSSNLLLPEI